MKLESKRCIPCRGGISPLTGEEADSYINEVPGWKLIDGKRKIRREFTHKDFGSALAFVNKIGEVAEEEGHHPDILFGWGYCTVVFYTHKIGGLHENDFIMAARVNVLYGESTGTTTP